MKTKSSWPTNCHLVGPIVLLAVLAIELVNADDGYHPDTVSQLNLSSEERVILDEITSESDSIKLFDWDKIQRSLFQSNEVINRSYTLQFRPPRIFLKSAERYEAEEIVGKTPVSIPR